MAYNRENLLLKIIDIQNIVIEYTNQYGSTQEWVFNNKIKPVYHISRKTFYSYLAVNARKELKELHNTRELQLQLF